MFGVKPLILTARHLMSMDPGPPTQLRPQNSLFVTRSAEDANSSTFCIFGGPNKSCFIKDLGRKHLVEDQTQKLFVLDEDQTQNTKQHKTLNAKHKTPSAKCVFICVLHFVSSEDPKTFCVVGGPNQLISHSSRYSVDTKSFCVIGGPNQLFSYTSGSSDDTNTFCVI